VGLVNLGPPENIVLELAAQSKTEIFIETGTFRGRTTRWASKHFKSVFTIEKSESIFDLHNKELSAIKGVKALLGDSRNHLPEILKEIGNNRALFWLDGHYSGGETAGVDDECPLLDELKCLSGRENDIILIDDARLFLSVPPEPLTPSAWPTITEIIDAVYVNGKRPFIQAIDDVIFIIPEDEQLKKVMTAYSRKRAIPFWHKLAVRKYDLSKDGLKTKLLKLKKRLTAGA
jgi:hypothetical protein